MTTKFGMEDYIATYCPNGRRCHEMNVEFARYFYSRNARTPQINMIIRNILTAAKDLEDVIRENSDELPKIDGLGLTTYMCMQDFFREKYRKQIGMPKKMKNRIRSHTVKTSGNGATKRNGGRYVSAY